MLFKCFSVCLSDFLKRMTYILHANGTASIKYTITFYHEVSIVISETAGISRASGANSLPNIKKFRTKFLRKLL